MIKNQVNKTTNCPLKKIDERAGAFSKLAPSDPKTKEKINDRNKLS